jgi:hypothetical protein
MTLPIPYRRVAPALAALALVALASAQAAAGPPPVPRSSDMILPLAEVQAIVKEPELEAKSINDRTSPWVDHSQDSHMPAPCRRFLNQDEEFGDTWINFKSAGYSGESNIGIHQNIAVYPDVGTAQRTFEALKTAAHQCRTNLSPQSGVTMYMLTDQDPNTLIGQYPDSVNGPGSVDITALRGQIIIGVSAAHFSTDPTIAQTVLAHIIHNIK